MVLLRLPIEAIVPKGRQSDVEALVCYASRYVDARVAAAHQARSERGKPCLRG
jgi:hypothetical protein